MTDTKRKHHALFVCYPLQGHIIPSVHLAIKLASNGFTVTFVNTIAVHHQQSKAQSGSSNDLFTAALSLGLDIRYELVSDGLPLEFDRSLNHDQFMASLFHVLPVHVDELIRRMGRTDPPITCIIADTFFVWPSSIAKKYGLVYVSFWTEPALVFTLYYHIDLLKKNGHFASADNRKDPINYIPGVPSIDPSDLTSYLQDTDIETICHQIIFKAFDEAKGADFVLCNTVQELEPATISSLQLETQFYAIGPIFPSRTSKSAVATSLWSESDCTEWLDSKTSNSVLYISFGSYAHITKRELEEIAMGVLLSKSNFVWVLRPDIVSSEDKDPLPPKFVQEIGERGIMVPWCRQKLVLSHPSIGAFLTHCGWNSILESIWNGVPMLCYPLLTDQFTNRKLVVDDWKIGIDIVKRKKAVNRKEVSEKINILKDVKLINELRRETREARTKLQKALDVNGSSMTSLNRFIHDLSDKVYG